MADYGASSSTDLGRDYANPGISAVLYARGISAAGLTGVLLPGEPERRTRAHGKDGGIAVPEDTWETTQTIAAGLKVTAPTAKG